MSKHERKLLKRRQAVEPAIGHLMADYQMNRCWLKSIMGDALHALSFAVTVVVKVDAMDASPF